MTPDPNERRDHDPELAADQEADGNTIAPLPGELGIPNVATRQRIAMSKKGLLAAVLFIGTLVTVAGFTIQSFVSSGKKFQDYLADEKKKGGKVYYFVTEHSRMSTLQNEIGKTVSFDKLTPPELNNKFGLVRAVFE